MQTYSCPSCKFHISEADKLWDSAIDSGRCPYCQEPLRSFPVRTKQQEETLPTHQPKRQEERPATQQPYPWGSVLKWAGMALLVTVISAVLNGRSYPLPDRLVGGVLVGLFWAALTAVIVGSWKYFKRTPSSFSFFGATGNTGLSSVNTWKRISAEGAMTKYARIAYFLLVGFAFIIPLMLISSVMGVIAAETLATAGLALGIGWSLNNKTRRLGVAKNSYVALCIVYLIVANALAILLPVTSNANNENRGYYFLLLVVVAYVFSRGAIKMNKEKPTKA